MTEGPNRDQSARDALDDLGLIDDDHTEDLRAYREGAVIEHDRL